MARRTKPVAPPPSINPNVPSPRVRDAKDPFASGGSWGPVPVMTSGMTFLEVGSSGLRAFSGWVREEFLPSLVGRQAAQKYREMWDNNPTIGALMFTFMATMRKVSWRVAPVDDSGEARQWADFVETCMDDMSHPWDELVSENLSMLPFGFAVHEIVYKRRLGRDPGTDPDRPGKQLPASMCDDGLIGWRRMPIRGQDTILKWFFDENGEIEGVTQQPWVGPLIDIPMEKCLLFRPYHIKNNPEGRALDPETLIPTPTGWSHLDDLHPGDSVFDESGRPTKITGRADWNNRPCYRVTFSDGSEIVADENHQWLTETLYQRTSTYKSRNRQPTIKTTKQIAQRVTTKHGQPIHSIKWAAPLQYPRKALPIDPYLLGLWLGDGDSNGGRIATNEADLEHVVEAVVSAGYAPRSAHNGLPAGLGCVVNISGGMTTALRERGLLRNKYVPEIYMRASVEQRLDLLRGLMDSDGYVSENGQCEFCNTNYSLLSAVDELVKSLGCGKTNVSRQPSTHSWSLTFSPPFIPFALPRKVARCKTRQRRTNHYIVAVQPVERRRTTCIEVASESHLFLAGTSLVPTHNSILRSAYIGYYYIKRMQEQEAILAERLGGVPLIKIPATLIEQANSGNAQAAAALAQYKRIAINLRIDEQMGVVIPSDMWPTATGSGSHPMYDFQLVTPQHRASAFEFDKTIQRYNIQMMTSVLADFLQLGHEARGTQSLAVSKVDMFFQAVEGYLNSIAAVYNRYALPRLWKLNGLDFELMPTIEPDLAQRIDLDVLSNFILRLSQAGMPLFPNDDLQTYILDAGGLPDIADPRALQALFGDQTMTDTGGNGSAVPAPGSPGGGPGAKEGDKPPGDGAMEKMLLASLARRYMKMNGPVHVRKRGRRRARPSI